MKFEIKNVKEEVFLSASDLEVLVPEEIGGRAVNYGQGEGQIEIGNTIWGIYALTSTSYAFQFEEGTIPLENFPGFINSILVSLNRCFGEQAKINIAGVLNELEPFEKYT